ncbi:nitrate- and nitrite sensing domain-containing protein [Neiella marina]|uniref:Nitrate- and nitrite sensing domain-containing protein n=1 Tax=Neiella holothuriorum TaxID=2870530 RepID=A0ABS7EDR0_9GAMM|nr:nitrate- and nitrite sensing domain-containing protein [Neiella holothuriorum]MBW8190456.1 nitrate- and nitrite sensing domain-containing protein [Neiella holothuriorum]
MNNYLEILIIIVTAGLLLISLVGWTNLRARRQSQQRYLTGISWLQQLRLLLTAVQQHRGLTNGFLNGDSKAKARIAEQQRIINAQINTLNRLGKWSHQNERWLSIQDHWERLASNYINQQASYALEQHNRLVLNLLYLIEDCAEQHHLQELYLTSNKSADELWKATLFNAEYIGQARALGTGVAAAHHCSSVARIRLKYIHSQLDSYCRQANDSNINEKLRPLLISLESDIMVAHPAINPLDYFSLATNALEAVVEVFDRGLEQLAQQLNSPASLKPNG